MRPPVVVHAIGSNDALSLTRLVGGAIGEGEASSAFGANELRRDAT
jgi:hypothetical protein